MPGIVTYGRPPLEKYSDAQPRDDDGRFSGGVSAMNLEASNPNPLPSHAAEAKASSEAGARQSRADMAAQGAHPFDSGPADMHPRSIGMSHGTPEYDKQLARWKAANPGAKEPGMHLSSFLSMLRRK